MVEVRTEKNLIFSWSINLKFQGLAIPLTIISIDVSNTLGVPCSHQFIIVSTVWGTILNRPSIRPASSNKIFEFIKVSHCLGTITLSRDNFNNRVSDFVDFSGSQQVLGSRCGSVRILGIFWLCNSMFIFCSCKIWWVQINQKMQ